MNMATQEIVRLGELCALLTGKKETTLGREMVNDGKFFARLRGGGEITTTTYHKTKAWLNERINAAQGL